MPLDIRSQVVTALGNINKNPELYTPPKPTTPLETRINGNEKARELLGKVGEDAARQRRGYEGLNKAIYAPAIIGAGALAALSGIGDILDIVGGISLTKRVGNGL